MKRKLADCITFFNENLMFDLRYNINKNVFDYFVICESRYDHKGNKKKLNFDYNKYKNNSKIKYLVLDEEFPKKNNAWQNQAIQREFLLKNLDFLDSEDYIFFSDPDEIPKTQILKNFFLKKKYGVFLQKFFNYKFNLFNKYETPWDGTRVCAKKNLKSIDFMRQKVFSKNIYYNFFRFDKERNVQIFQDAGWHFNNIMNPEQISLKLKTFAHREYSLEKFSSVNVIKKKIENREDLFERGQIYEIIPLDNTFPEYLVSNQNMYFDYIL